jgi:hypothetical protein
VNPKRGGSPPKPEPVADALSPECEGQVAFNFASVAATRELSVAVMLFTEPISLSRNDVPAATDQPKERSLACDFRAFQSHHSSTPTGCRCRILIREFVAVDRDETLLIRIVPRGKAAADNL